MGLTDDLASFVDSCDKLKFMAASICIPLVVPSNVQFDLVVGHQIPEVGVPHLPQSHAQREGQLLLADSEQKHTDILIMIMTEETPLQSARVL